ncbi:hypothetical protein D1159_03945 [Pseudoflavonifractor sp. 524-17]|uniref:sigma factor-like helix-turn-helix DNA-binding protein n=1 Tax=Pseudoflavonifractor sp. 524-17 TaxID=2304577 RepID=UPI001379B3A2|nr:hypothetical protein [Pseudoflavonifractor sp. 524-17]
MNSQNRAIRALLSSMSTDRAIDTIRAFRLPEKEEICLIEKEVFDRSYTQICREYGFSPEAVKKARRRAFEKIVDAIAYEKERARGG